MADVKFKWGSDATNSAPEIEAGSLIFDNNTSGMYIDNQDNSRVLIRPPEYPSSLLIGHQDWGSHTTGPIFEFGQWVHNLDPYFPFIVKDAVLGTKNQITASYNLRFTRDPSQGRNSAGYYERVYVSNMINVKDGSNLIPLDNQWNIGIRFQLISRCFIVICKHISIYNI